MSGLESERWSNMDGVRRGLAIGSTGTYPRFGPLPCVFFIIIIIYFVCIFLPSQYAKAIISDCGIP